MRLVRTRRFGTGRGPAVAGSRRVRSNRDGGRRRLCAAARRRLSSGRTAASSPSSVKGGLTTTSPQPLRRSGSVGRSSVSSTRKELGHGERGQGRVESGDRLAVLDRVPGDIDAGGETLQALRQPFGHTVQLVSLLERRIDQDDAAALLRRQHGLERDPGVERHHLGPAVAPDGRLEDARALPGAARWRSACPGDASGRARWQGLPG